MRKKRGLTQRQLGDALGLSRNYIPALEEGARRPGRDVQQRLMDYFGCRFEHLFVVVLVDPQTSEERHLYLNSTRPRSKVR
jgi:transcriptional regulator with XRE-family HTH domain